MAKYIRKTGRFRRRPRRLIRRRPNRTAFALGKAKPTRRMLSSYRMSSMGQEKKNCYQSQATQLINNGGSFIQLVIINQGITDQNRIGNKIFCRYVRFRGYFFQNNSNTPLIRAILAVPKIVSATPAMPTTYTDSVNLDAWSVIWDKIITLGNPLTTNFVNTGQPAYRQFNWTQKIFLPLNFISNTSVTPTTPIPQLYVYCNESAAPYPQLIYSVNTTFTDA